MPTDRIRALGVVAIASLFCELDRDRAGAWPIAGVLAAMSAPLYWFTAARPLSDMTGLAAAVAIQALTIASSTRGDTPTWTSQSSCASSRSISPSI